MEQTTANAEQLAGADGAPQTIRTSDWTRDFMIAAQKLALEELVFAGGETFDRAVTEMHLFNELVSKMAEVHSVRNMQTMFEECSQHQLDFLRRDSDRLLRHTQRAIEAASKLASALAESGRPPP
jgi:hypothetical protein